MSFLWDSLYSVFARTRNYLVDPLGEENPENPELAITGERRGTTAYKTLILTNRKAAWYIISRASAHVSVCLMITFESLDVGSLFSLILYVSS